VARVPLTPPLALADGDWVDLGALLVAALFLVWGAVRGALRQTLGLVALAAGFALAGGLSPRLVPSMRKVATLGPEGLACLAWWTVLLGTLVVAGVLIHALRARIDRVRVLGRADRWLGGAVGLAKGFVAVGLGLYATLGWWVDERGPAFVEALRASRTARAVARAGEGLLPALALPDAVASRVDAVNAGLRPPPVATSREDAGRPASSEGDARR
jgi:uncharacterized membrane protein required for colicin V production